MHTSITYIIFFIWILHYSSLPYFCWHIYIFRQISERCSRGHIQITHILTGDPLHSRALAHSRAQLFTQPCPHCSHSRTPGEQWARLCVFALQGCVQAARLCRGSPVILPSSHWYPAADNHKITRCWKQRTIYDGVIWIMQLHVCMV